MWREHRGLLSTSCWFALFSWARSFGSHGLAPHAKRGSHILPLHASSVRTRFRHTVLRIRTRDLYTSSPAHMSRLDTSKWFTRNLSTYLGGSHPHKVSPYRAKPRGSHSKPTQGLLGSHTSSAHRRPRLASELFPGRSRLATQSCTFIEVLAQGV